MHFYYQRAPWHRQTELKCPPSSLPERISSCKRDRCNHRQIFQPARKKALPPFPKGLQPSCKRVRSNGLDARHPTEPPQAIQCHSSFSMVAKYWAFSVSHKLNLTNYQIMPIYLPVFSQGRSPSKSSRGTLHLTPQYRTLFHDRDSCERKAIPV